MAERSPLSGINTPRDVTLAFFQAQEAGIADEEFKLALIDRIKAQGLDCYVNGMTKSDWTDWTLHRLRNKLDQAKTHPKLLTPWMRAVIFGLLKEAKAGGPDWRIPEDRMRQVRDILATRVEDAAELVEDA